MENLYNKNLVFVEITTKDRFKENYSAVSFYGYPIVEASGKNTVAKLCKNISYICGTFGSGGSYKHWYTYISKGSTFRLKMSKNLLDQHDLCKERYFEFKILSDA